MRLLLSVLTLSPTALPRTPDGHPDLQGTWLNDTVTMLERPNRFGDMTHDARIVRMNAPHLPPAIRLWLGDSVGRWEGDTLVVDTTNFTGKTRWRQSGERLHTVERFTPESGMQIRYEFSVEDASTYTQIWSGRLWMTRTMNAMYEYACHEGNYSLVGILRGARADERRNRAER